MNPSQQNKGQPQTGLERVVEEAALDAALDRPDELLVSSLREEDQTRRYRRIGSLLVVVLLVVCAAFLLTLPKDGLAADASALSQQGWQLWQQRRLADAEAKFTQAVDLDAKLDSAWNGLGWARLNQGKTDEAIAAFEKCVALVPNHPAAQNGLGQAYLSLRKYDLAEKHLNIAAEREAPAAWYGLMRLHILQGNYDDAQKWAEKVAGANPQDELAKKILAAAEAKELPNDLRQLIEPPDQESTNALRGWQLMNSGQMAKAREAFEQVLAENPDETIALNGLGFCLLNSGEPDKARPQFEKLLKLEPNHGGAKNGLARCLKSAGDVDGAVKLWEQLVSDAPGVNAGHAGLAEVYLERKDYAKAVEFYEKLVAAAPGNQFYQQRLEAAQAGLEE